MSKKKINKVETVRNIRAKAEGNIRDIDAFNKLMENEEDILDACIMWEAEVVYYEGRTNPNATQYNPYEDKN
jgi:hypothetical protein